MGPMVSIAGDEVDPLGATEDRNRTPIQRLSQTVVLYEQGSAWRRGGHRLRLGCYNSNGSPSGDPMPVPRPEPVS